MMSPVPRGVAHFVCTNIQVDKLHFRQRRTELQLSGSKKRAEILYHFVHLPTKQFFLSRLTNKVEQKVHILFRFQWWHHKSMAAYTLVSSSGAGIFIRCHAPSFLNVINMLSS